MRDVVFPKFVQKPFSKNVLVRNKILNHNNKKIDTNMICFYVSISAFPKNVGYSIFYEVSKEHHIIITVSFS